MSRRHIRVVYPYGREPENHVVIEIDPVDLHLDDEALLNKYRSAIEDELWGRVEVFIESTHLIDPDGSVPDLVRVVPELGLTTIAVCDDPSRGTKE